MIYYYQNLNITSHIIINQMKKKKEKKEPFYYFIEIFSTSTIKIMLDINLFYTSSLPKQGFSTLAIDSECSESH